MNKANLLIKLSPVGVAVFSMISGSILVAPSASAVDICFEGPITVPPASGPFGTLPNSVQCQDKLFSNIVFDSEFDVSDETVIIQNDEISGDLGTYLFEWEAAAGLEFGPGNSFDITYDVEITDPDFVFQAIDIDSLVDVFSDIRFDKEVTVLEAKLPGSVGQVVNLESVRGDAEFVDISDLKATKLGILDTVAFGTGTPGPNSGGLGEISGLENSFLQEEHMKPVPEPATILGFLAFGGLGLGLKRKKKLLRVG